MTLITNGSAVLIISLFCTAHAISISGSVTDTGGVGLAGAAVKLENSGQTATTDAAGNFTLGNPVKIVRHTNAFSTSKGITFLSQNILSVKVKEPGEVTVKVFACNGRLLTCQEKSVAAGANAIILPQMGAGLHIHQILINNEEYSFRSVGREPAKSVVASGSSQKAKAAVRINDVINVAKAGWLTYRDSVRNSDTSGMKIYLIPSAGTLTDVDGNAYQTVRLGNQVWTVENLKTTRYNDGSAIAYLPVDNEWYTSTTGAYSYYNNDMANNAKYGALYNWNAIGPGKLAPAGWHVPNDSEWTILGDYLIANGYNYNQSSTVDSTAKSLAAKTNWQPSDYNGVPGNNISANNATGFSVVPGGLRNGVGTFNSEGYDCFFWTSTYLGLETSWNRSVHSHHPDLSRYTSSSKSGFYIRLVKD